MVVAVSDAAFSKTTLPKIRQKYGGSHIGCRIFENNTAKNTAKSTAIAVLITVSRIPASVIF